MHIHTQKKNKTHDADGEDILAPVRVAAASASAVRSKAEAEATTEKKDDDTDNDNENHDDYGSLVSLLPNDALRCICLAVLASSDHDARAMAAVAGVCKQWRREMKELALSGDVSTRMSLSPRRWQPPPPPPTECNTPRSPNSPTRSPNSPSSPSSPSSSSAALPTPPGRRAAGLQYVYCMSCCCLHASSPSMAPWLCGTVEELFLSGEECLFYFIFCLFFWVGEEGLFEKQRLSSSC